MGRFLFCIAFLISILVGLQAAAVVSGDAGRQYFEQDRDVYVRGGSEHLRCS